MIAKEMRYAIPSYQATIFSITCFAYILLRAGFEKLRGTIPLLRRMEKQFNSFVLRIGRSVLNEKLVGAQFFDAIELHLTDPRLFYNPFEWKINEKMIKLVRGPIASFHAHVEADPLLRKYAFNLCETSPKTRKAVRSQLVTTYKIMHAYPNLIMTETPVFVFHAGVARDEDDREKALARMRESIEYIAITNNQLYEDYGRDRKIVPTIENSASDRLSLCQTIDEWRRAIQGFEDEIKLTLDYGHVQTVEGEKNKLLKELRKGTLGKNILNLHLHYSPEIDHEIRHAHAALSKIPESRLKDFQNSLREIVSSTGIRKQGYITLEVPSKDPVDYVPSLRHLKKGFSVVNRILKSAGVFDWSAYRGTIEDQLASLKMAKEMIRA